MRRDNRANFRLRQWTPVPTGEAIRWTAVVIRVRQLDVKKNGARPF